MNNIKPKSKAATPKAVVKSVELVVTDGNTLDYPDITKFIAEQAGGNEANVQIVCLPNVDKTGSEPLPFGYGGSKGGVRQQIQDWMIFGVDGDTSLKTVLGKAAKLGHSKKRPNCVLAAMNGGYSPSSKYWGTPYIKLVVQG